MNRAERRKLEKKGYSQVSIMKLYREEAVEQGFHNGMKHVEEVMFYITAYTLQYKLDFGPKRLQRVMKDIFNNIDAFRTGHLTSGDFQTIKEEMRSKYGVNLL